LRSQTATVPSIPIICSSIMSKKIAEGIMGLVMDIKVGNGAFMKTKNDAFKLSHLIQKVAISYGIEIDIIYSDMNQPLGKYAGLGCEIKEAMDCLLGKGSKDLMDNTFELCSCLLIQAGKAKNKQESKEIFDKIIKTGKAFEFFQKMIFLQNGCLKKFKKNIVPKFEKIIRSNKEGTLIFMDTEKIGWSLIELGCGKKKKLDKLDNTAGIEFLVKPGEKIKKGSPIYRVFNTNSKKLDSASELLLNTIRVNN